MGQGNECGWKKGLVYFSSARLVLEWTFQQFIERRLARTSSRASTTLYKGPNRVQLEVTGRSLFTSSQPPRLALPATNGSLQNCPSDAFLRSSVLSVRGGYCAALIDV